MWKLQWQKNFRKIYVICALFLGLIGILIGISLLDINLELTLEIFLKLLQNESFFYEILEGLISLCLFCHIYYNYEQNDESNYSTTYVMAKGEGKEPISDNSTNKNELIATSTDNSASSSSVNNIEEKKKSHSVEEANLEPRKNKGKRKADWDSIHSDNPLLNVIESDETKKQIDYDYNYAKKLQEEYWSNKEQLREQDYLSEKTQSSDSDDSEIIDTNTINSEDDQEMVEKKLALQQLDLKLQQEKKDRDLAMELQEEQNKIEKLQVEDKQIQKSESSKTAIKRGEGKGI